MQKPNWIAAEITGKRYLHPRIERKDESCVILQEISKVLRLWEHRQSSESDGKQKAKRPLLDGRKKFLWKFDLRSQRSHQIDRKWVCQGISLRLHHLWNKMQRNERNLPTHPGGWLRRSHLLWPKKANLEVLGGLYQQDEQQAIRIRFSSWDYPLSGRKTIRAYWEIRHRTQICKNIHQQFDPTLKTNHEPTPTPILGNQKLGQEVLSYEYRQNHHQ
jgi:hypothetical protein